MAGRYPTCAAITSSWRAARTAASGEAFAGFSVSSCSRAGRAVTVPARERPTARPRRCACPSPPRRCPPCRELPRSASARRPRPSPGGVLGHSSPGTHRAQCGRPRPVRDLAVVDAHCDTDWPPVPEPVSKKTGPGRFRRPGARRPHPRGKSRTPPSSPLPLTHDSLQPFCPYPWRPSRPGDDEAAAPTGPLPDSPNGREARSNLWTRPRTPCATCPRAALQLRQKQNRYPAPPTSGASALAHPGEAGVTVRAYVGLRRAPLPTPACPGTG